MAAWREKPAAVEHFPLGVIRSEPALRTRGMAHLPPSPTDRRLPFTALRSPLTALLLALAAPCASPSAFAAAGDADSSFTGSTDGTVTAVATQPDGKVLIGGSFTKVGTTTRTRIARLNASGSLDTSFNQSVSNTVNTIAVQPDGRILVGGTFTPVAGVSGNFIARLNADGTGDPDFHPAFDAAVNCLHLLPDGRILVSGNFSFSGPSLTNVGIARLHPDGTFDTSWGAATNGSVTATVIQADGKIVIGGAFTTVNGQPANRLARLEADGALDSSFSASCDAGVLGLAVQPDGKVLVVGTFTAPGGQTSTPRLARFNADGSIDTTFVPPAPASRVWGVSLQTDGKVLAVGDFIRVGPTTGGTTRNRLARFSGSNGALDTVFNPNASGSVQSASFQNDGKILIGGTFATIGGVAHGNYARLMNDTSTQTLTAPDFSRIQWLRSGASVEVHQVTFEVSTDNGATYAAAVNAVRTTGGWEATGLVLPTSGRIRARARVQGGSFGGGNGLIESTANYGPLPSPPEIVVESPPGANQDTTGTVGFAPTVLGTSTGAVFVVRNTGQTALSLTYSPTAALFGANASQFSVVAQPPNTVAPGASVSFTVRYTPSTVGSANAVLYLENNDPTGGEGGFYVFLTGTGLDAHATGGWVNGGAFTVGTSGNTENTNTWPPTQSPDKAVDGDVNSKYLLFKTSNAAFGYNPPAPAVYNTLALTTAEDAVERDPTSYLIYGSATTLPNTPGLSAPVAGLTLLASGSLSLPAARRAGPTTLTFPNSTAYAGYLVVFPTVKNTPAAANSTQLSEIRLSLTDTTGPTGGSLQLSPASPLDAGSGLSVALPDWTDPTGPLAYEFLIDDVVVSARGASHARSLVAPATAGLHVLKGRIYDGANNLTEVTQSFIVNTALESWRRIYFGSTANSGNGADHFDYDGDGLTNLAEFAFGLDPTKPSAGQMPQAQFDGSTLQIAFATPPGVTGLTYGAEWTTDLAGTWQPVTDTGLGGQHVFSVPATGQMRVFLRLTVTMP